MNFTKLSLSISSIVDRLPRKSFEKMVIHKIPIGHDSNYDRIPSSKFADKHIWKGHSTLGIRFYKTLTQTLLQAAKAPVSSRKAARTASGKPRTRTSDSAQIYE